MFVALVYVQYLRETLVVGVEMANKVWTVGWSIDRTKPVLKCHQTECCVKKCTFKTMKKYFLKNKFDTHSRRWKAPICEKCSMIPSDLEFKIHSELLQLDSIDVNSGGHIT